MTIRSGMATLILTLREYTDVSEGDTEVNGVPYWQDEQLQAILDQYRVEAIDVSLQSFPLREAGSLVYKRYYLPDTIGKWIEEDDGTDTIFSVVDGQGNLAPNYVFDPNGKVVTFTADQRGTSYYIRCRFFDMYAAASDVWYKKAGQRAGLIDWKAGGQSLSEDQEYQHCIERGEFYASKHGITVIHMQRKDYGETNWL